MIRTLLASACYLAAGVLFLNGMPLAGVCWMSAGTSLMVTAPGSRDE